MTTFTDKELIKEIKERIGSLDVRDNIERRAYEIALASLEADPVAYIFKHPAGKLFWALTDESNKEQADVIPVYAAPPVPVVPEEKPMPNALSMLEREITQLIGDAQEATVTGYELIAEAWRLMDGQDPKTSDWHSKASKYLNSNIVEKVDDDRIEAVKAVLRRLAGNSPVTPDGWISCSERMPVIGELNWRTSFPLLITCEIGVIPAYYGFVSVNGDRHYGFMESLKYGDDSGGHPQTNEYGLISNVTHYMPLPEPPQQDGE
ncbi:TPA: DUF551 domain-containing protein [Escherichia coli]|uniref:DUF551 domain-containing protein n=1 Tax=Escherichia coli TaxID=562 RepID=UPI0019DB43E2|nr:DUF551 domain-containing protein [Escherichia coli]EGP4637881.1 DUF551 domain-containing protein [Escherichia coli]MCM2960827.1 DUF551 domain-containing protein [Escherichia coli]